MKNIIIIILAFLTLSCNENTKKQDRLNLLNNEEDIVEDWDKHKFYDDLEHLDLITLSKVIDNADSIVAFNWNEHNGNSANTQSYFVDAYGNYEGATNNGLLLTKENKEEFKLLVCDSSNFESGTSSCFIPHISFIFYKQQQIIGQSNVCFLCAEIKSIPKSTTSLSKKGYRLIKSFCIKLGLEIVDGSKRLNY